MEDHGTYVMEGMVDHLFASVQNTKPVALKAIHRDGRRPCLWIGGRCAKGEVQFQIIAGADLLGEKSTTVAQPPP
ncbi:hypothetical protein AB0F88_06915 [Streptosporangium sp. NPDC023963]|uniref:hypothetical protein n=1 Tax=Streptosporangium sp. NPDC023963 TaxID=3155608 RepID=UPI003414D097